MAQRVKRSGATRARRRQPPRPGLHGERRVFQTGNSWVIPIPLHIRRHLGVVDGGALYWHFGPEGEAAVTVKEERAGGRPPGLRLVRELEQARRRITRLRRRLQARPLKVLHEGVAQGWAAVAGVEARLHADVTTLRERVERLLDLVEPRARVLRRRPVRAVAAREQPSPSAPSSSSEIDGGADTSGAGPPGVPS